MRITDGTPPRARRKLVDPQPSLPKGAGVGPSKLPFRAQTWSLARTRSTK
jgi:hypothetical protein